jgi:hypothetical protein
MTIPNLNSIVLRIKVERSGGFAGMTVSNEMDSKDLPSALKDMAQKILEDKNVSSPSMMSTPKGSADHFTYKISIQDGANQNVIESNQFDIQDNLKTLVNYIEKNSNKRK